MYPLILPSELTGEMFVSHCSYYRKVTIAVNTGILKASFRTQKGLNNILCVPNRDLFEAL